VTPGVALMSNRVVPFLRLAVLCQDVEFDGNGLPFKLVEPLHTIRLAPDRFGRPLTGMFLYTQLEDANGTFEFSVRVQDENGSPVAQPNLRAVAHTFAGAEEERIVPFELTLRLAGVVLPGPGVYHFQVRCDTVSLHQWDGAARAPLLRVLSE
jgi:hypothetical protein